MGNVTKNILGSLNTGGLVKLQLFGALEVGICKTWMMDLRAIIPTPSRNYSLTEGMHSTERVRVCGLYEC